MMTTAKRRASRPRSLHLVAWALATAMAFGWATTAATAAPSDGAGDLITDYRAWLDQARTPAAAVAWLEGRSPGWSRIDYARDKPRRPEPGTRLLFTSRGRTALFVIVGREPLADVGMRLMAAHIDTPSPRIDLTDIAMNRARAPLTARAHRYGGMRPHHWLHIPLALVGRVAVTGEREVDVALGLADDDDIALYATSGGDRGGALEIVLGTIPPAGDKGKQKDGAAKGQSKPENENENAAPRDAGWLLTELERRYGVKRGDLAATELFLVPRARAREVGLDRAIIGAHGQDDRANSYIAWRAITSLEGVPERTVAVWLIDREETGSHHTAGAASYFLEAVFAYLLRSQGAAATEATLARAFGRSQAISADTPSALNPNFLEVHEPLNAPVVGRGAVLFPYTGSEGKSDGAAAHPALIRSVIRAFERAGQPIQYGTLGRVDEGGGGTVAKYLANRGIDVVDVGVAGISLHSPMELFAKDDIVSAYHGFRAWMAGP